MQPDIVLQTTLGETVGLGFVAIRVLQFTWNTLRIVCAVNMRPRREARLVSPWLPGQAPALP